MGFDGSSIEGYARRDESDMYAVPDPTTFSILPWRPRTNAVARMFCDVVTPDGRPFEGDPRAVLKRNIKRAADLGYTYYVGPEIEYFTSRTPGVHSHWTRAATSTRSLPTWPPTCAAKRC